MKTFSYFCGVKFKIKSNNFQTFTIMITREEYLSKMQEYRELLQSNAKRNREAFDALDDEYRQKKQKLFEEHEAKKRELRNKRTEAQHEIEHKMHELKVQWAKEHPIEEVKVVE